VRYIGISHYTASAYAEVEAVLRSEPLDFLQINYSVQEQEAAQRLLPLAQERQVAVLVNRPFGGGGLMRRLQGKPLPGWATEIGCTTWSQVLLKFALSHPAVTCVIPGSGSPEHMAQNAMAGCGVQPEAAWWHHKIEEIRSL
jgi:diketogulonate reductase-like aldo/keto reductase